MIVRLMGEGQYRVPDDAVERLNQLDDDAHAAVEANDEPKLDGLLDEMWELVQACAERLVDLVLAVSRQPRDHCSISFFVSPDPSSPFMRASSSSTWLPAEI